MKKKSKVDKAAARAVSQLIRSEYNKLRDTLVMNLEDRFKLYDEYLENHKLMEKHPKALRAVRADMKKALRYLKQEVKIVVPECRDSALEIALEKEFKLMTIAGRVSGR